MTNQEKILAVNECMCRIVNNFRGRNIDELYSKVQSAVEELDTKLGGLLPSLSYSPTSLRDVWHIRVEHDEVEMIEVIPWLYPQVIGKELYVYGMIEGRTTSNIIGYIRFTRCRLPDIGFYKEVLPVHTLGAYWYESDRFDNFQRE